MSHTALSRPFGSPPLTDEQRRVRALPGLALPVPTLLDAVLDLQPLRYAVVLPLTETRRDGVAALPALPAPTEETTRAHA